jgi:GTPase SAR1 family protein
MADDADILPLQNALRGKNEFHILVVGRNGHGKSSLINRLYGDEVALVQTGPHPVRHGYVETHQRRIEDTDVFFYDTRGFADPDIMGYQNILSTIYSEGRSYDVVLICHKLYEPVDVNTLQGFNDLGKYLGDELMSKSILVCTFGDSYRTNDAFRIGGENRDDNVIAEMISNRERIHLAIIRSLNFTHDIPVCITSGVEYILPTPRPQNWKGNLCRLIEIRSRGDPKPFVNWYKRKSSTFVVVGAAGGAIIGAGIGSVVPGIGTAIGAGVGAVIGLFGGGSAGGIASVTGEKLTQPTRHS